MKTVICDEADTIRDSTVLLCAGEVLEEHMIVSDYPGIKDGARIVLQKRPLLVSLQREEVKCTVTLPQVCVIKIYTVALYSFIQGIDARFLNQWISSTTGNTLTQLECNGLYKCNRECSLPSPHVSKDCNIIKKSGWVLDVQGIDGNKVSVHVPERMVSLSHLHMHWYVLYQVFFCRVHLFLC